MKAIGWTLVYNKGFVNRLLQCLTTTWTYHHRC